MDFYWTFSRRWILTGYHLHFALGGSYQRQMLQQNLHVIVETCWSLIDPFINTVR
jgi:hypothetical protein